MPLLSSLGPAVFINVSLRYFEYIRILYAMYSKSQLEGPVLEVEMVMEVRVVIEVAEGRIAVVPRKQELFTHLVMKVHWT